MISVFNFHCFFASFLLQRNGPSRLMDAGSTNQFEQKTRAYHNINHFLGSVIDHVSADP